jgi:solute:Na+ symporter, SSS family
MAFPMLAEVTLPSIAKGVFYTGMLATIMSTLNTLAFVSATTLGRDIVWRWKEEQSEERVNRYTQWGLVVSGVLSIVLALLIPSVIKLWYAIGTVVIPGLLVVLVTAYFDKYRVAAPFAFYSMLCGWLTSLSWLLVGWTQELGNSDYYPFGVEPMYPGLMVALLVWGIGMRKKQRGAQAAVVQ